MRHRGQAIGSESLPGGHSLYLIIFLHSFVELAVWITVLVVAFDRGGAAATGLAVAVQLLPAAVSAPVVTAAGDRFDRRTVLAVGLGALAFASGGLTLALAADLPLAVIYLFASIFTIALGSTPGTVASLVVHHARSPRELTDWNIGISLGRAAGSLVGPMATAALLAISEPWVITALSAATCAFAATVVVRRLPDDDRASAAISLRSVLADSRTGIGYAVRTQAARRIIGFLALCGLLLGAFEVLFVAVAFDQLGRGGSAAAMLNAAFAIGAVLVALVVSRRMPRTLTTLTVVGAMLLSLPLLVLGEPSRLLPVALLIALLGAGNALIEIGSHTLLQRSCDEALTSRVFGVHDSALLVAWSAGGAGAGLLIGTEVSSRGLAVVGVVAAVLLTAVATSLRAIERRTTPASPDVVAALQRVEFLRPLPLPTIERLAAGAERRTVRPDAAIVEQGAPGHEFFVLLRGEILVSIDDTPVERASAPASFGEVALLDDGDRTATVSATTQCTLAVISRGPFLDAVRRSTTGHRSAMATAARYRRSTSDDSSAAGPEE